MASLLDIINRNLATAPDAEMQDNTERARQLLAAKSGRAVSAPTSLTSNLAEQTALDQTNQGLADERQQAGLAGAQLQQQQANLGATEGLARQDVELQRRGQEQNARLQSNQILADWEQGRQQLNLDRDRSKLEQLGFNLAQQDKQYLDNLDMVGSRRRLDNELSFKQDMARNTVMDMEKLLGSRLNYDALLSNDRRAFEEEITRMKAEMEARLDTTINNAQIEAQRIGAGSELAGAGIQAAGKK